MSVEEDKVIKRTVSYLGKDCPVCENDFKPYITDLASKSTEIPIEISEINEEDGKSIIQEKHLVDESGHIKTPYVKRCNIYKSGKEDCKDIEGFSKEDYADWEPQV